MELSLLNKNIALIIGGGVAAYKSLDLIRRLRERGAKVQVILTKGALQFITSLAASSLAGQPAFSQLFATQEGYDIGHIRLSRAADLILIAPLTASRMAKMVAGLADDLAGAILLAANCPKLAAPAMNPAMWAHQATKRNLAQLIADGVEIIGPEWGEMAEAGEVGQGRMSKVADIITRVEHILTSSHMPARAFFEKVDTGLSQKNALKQKSKAVKCVNINENRSSQIIVPSSFSLTGKHIIITAGPTYEPIDPVRFLANRSSGKQGYALAQACTDLGAKVTLISGPVTLPKPEPVTLIHVETAQDMLSAVEQTLPADVAIFVAAVADWRLNQPRTQKMKKQAGQDCLTLHLVKNPDILATIAKSTCRPQLVIGFAAETDDLLTHAKAKQIAKGADWIVANDVSITKKGGSIMGGDNTKIHIVSDEGVESWPMMRKSEMAAKFADKIAKTINGNDGDGNPG